MRLEKSNILHWSVHSVSTSNAKNRSNLIILSTGPSPNAQSSILIVSLCRLLLQPSLISTFVPRVTQCSSAGCHVTLVIRSGYTGIWNKLSRACIILDPVRVIGHNRRVQIYLHNTPRRAFVRKMQNHISSLRFCYSTNTEPCIL